MFSVAISNFIFFPAAWYLWKRPYGYVSDMDEVFWIVGTIMTMFWWGFFLLIFLFDNSSIILIWIPYWITLFFTLPVSGVIFAEVYDPDFATEEALTIASYWAFQAASLVVILNHRLRASYYIREYLYESETDQVRDIESSIEINKPSNADDDIEEEGGISNRTNFDF